MSRILSQEEVRALLQQPVVAESSGAVDAESQTVAPYDFRERERMPRTRLRYLQYLHDRFAQYVSVSLSAYLRNGTDVVLENIQQRSSRRVLHELSDPTAIFIAKSSNGGEVAMVVDNELALAFVDRQLGGTGEKPILERALTEIEQSVLQGLVEVVLSALKQAWAPMLDVTLSIERAETRPGLVTLEPPEEARVVLKLNVSLGSSERSVAGSIQVILPVEVAETLSTELARDFGRDRERTDLSVAELRRMESRLLRTRVGLTVDLSAREVTAGDLIELKPGHVLNLGRGMDEPAVMKVGGAPKFEAVLVLSHGQPAVEIKERIDE